MNQRNYQNYPPPGSGEPAKFELDHSGLVVASRPDGTVVGKSNSVEAHLHFAILRQLQGKPT